MQAAVARPFLAVLPGFGSQLLSCIESDGIATWFLSLLSLHAYGSVTNICLPILRCVFPPIKRGCTQRSCPGRCICRFYSCCPICPWLVCHSFPCCRSCKMSSCRISCRPTCWGFRMPHNGEAAARFPAATADLCSGRERERGW